MKTPITVLGVLFLGIVALAALPTADAGTTCATGKSYCVCAIDCYDTSDETSCAAGAGVRSADMTGFVCYPGANP